MNHRDWQHYTCALIDPLRVENALWENWPVYEVAHKSLLAQRHLMPKLIDLGAISAMKRIEILDSASQWQYANQVDWVFDAFLISDRPIAEIAGALATRQLNRSPDGEKFYMRYQDPRVMRHLSWLLTPLQIDVLLGPVQVWVYPGRNGQWIRQPRQAIPPINTLTLKPAQWASLKRMGELNHLLDSLAKTHPALSVKPSFADALLARAIDKEGLTIPEDWMLYAEQAILVSDHIHQCSVLRERLERVRSGNMSYVAACADVSIEALQSEKNILGVSHGM